MLFVNWNIRFFVIILVVSYSCSFSLIESLMFFEFLNIVIN